MYETIITHREGVVAHLARSGHLRGVVLSHIDVSGIDRSGVDLSGAQLVGVSLRRARLCGASLAGVRAEAIAAPQPVDAPSPEVPRLSAWMTDEDAAPARLVLPALPAAPDARRVDTGTLDLDDALVADILAGGPSPEAPVELDTALLEEIDPNATQSLDLGAFDDLTAAATTAPRGRVRRQRDAAPRHAERVPDGRGAARARPAAARTVRRSARVVRRVNGDGAARPARRRPFRGAAP